MAHHVTQIHPHVEGIGRVELTHRRFARRTAALKVTRDYLRKRAGLPPRISFNIDELVKNQEELLALVEDALR